jgi:peptidyl-prolyl cis-trans isomerase B (cyclophilin B)
LHPGHVEKLDGNYSIFGQVTKGMEVARKLSKGDKIQSIDILDPTESLFARYKTRLAEWNKVLDQRFGSRLTPAPDNP